MTNELIQQHAFTFTTRPSTGWVPDDGACLFHSISTLMTGAHSHPESLRLRKESNNFIQTHWWWCFITHRESFQEELTYNENIPLRHPNGDIVYEFFPADEPLPGERRRPNVKRAKYHRDPVTDFPLQVHYTVETYLDTNSSPTHFGQDSSINAMACFLKQPIACWQRTDDIRLNDCTSANILNIYLDVGNRHYSPIVVVKDGSLAVPSRILPPSSPVDHHVDDDDENDVARRVVEYVREQQANHPI